jgi:glyoxylase I family protein
MEQPTLAFGMLRRVHHIAFNVRSLDASRHFWGQILGFHELTGTELPETLKALAMAGKVASFVMPDDTIIDLFFEPSLVPPNPDPTQQFTRANHLAFDIAPECFDQAVSVLKTHQVPIDHEPVSRPTGRGIYFYDPDGFMVEIRCNAMNLSAISEVQLTTSS